MSNTGQPSGPRDSGPGSLFDPASPPYPAPPGFIWSWVPTYHLEQPNMWMQVPFSHKTGFIGLERPAWSGQEVDYQNNWRKPRKARAWWKRILWLPWKKY